MRKVRFFILTLMAACSISVVSCNKPQETPKNNEEQKEDPGKEDPGKEDPGKEDPGKEEPKGTVFEVTCSDGTITFGADDILGVYPADGLAEPFTTSADKIEGGKATFSNEEKFDTDTYYAVYPYSEEDLLIEGVLYTILPFEHSVDNIAAHNISVAKVADGKADLKNVLGFVKINVTDSDFTEIVLRSKDTKASLAGKVEITIPDSGNPTVEVLDGVPFVTLVPAEGKETIDPGTYNIPVLPAAMSEGISLRAKVHSFTEGKMYVKNIDPKTVARAEAIDLGGVAKDASFEEFVEFIVNDDASGFAGCYREFGTKSIDTNPNRIFNLGDYDLSTYWNMPPGGFAGAGGTGKAYDIDGNETIRGSYVRWEFHKASGSYPKTEEIYFEYSLAYDETTPDNTYALDWAPWTLDIRDYNIWEGDKYGTIQHLTVENDALPWTNEYNNRYVSNAVLPGYQSGRLITCCTRTRWNDDHELQPKDAVEGVTFKNLAMDPPESRWALAELHVWMKPIYEQ